MEIHQFWVFATAVFLLNITPGNDFIYIASRSITYGKKAGIISGLGISLGLIVHIIASVLGLSVILAESSIAFNIVKYIGAAYLIYLGIKTLWDRTNNIGNMNGDEVPSNKKLLRQGFITNVFNPKVALFFLSFLPQFVNPSKGNVSLQLLTLGLWFVISGTAVSILIALTFSTMKNILMRFPGFWKWQKKITGVVLIGLGLKIALSDRK